MWAIAAGDSAAADVPLQRLVSFFEVATDRVMVRDATSEAPGLLIEMSDVSITLLGGLVGHPSCRTRPAACTRGVGHHADRHP